MLCSAATGVTLIAFLLSFPNTATMALFTLLTSLLAAILSFIAFIIDIPLRVFVRRQVEKLQLPVETQFGRGSCTVISLTCVDAEEIALQHSGLILRRSYSS
jgi:hypothetical protein